MAKSVWRYQIYFGLAGCYMPDSRYGAFEGTTRRELASMIRDAIDMYDLPRSLFSEVRINNLWRHIKRHGSSSAHFTLHHKQNALTFSGMTEDEYKAYEGRKR